MMVEKQVQGMVGGVRSDQGKVIITIQFLWKTTGHGHGHDVAAGVLWREVISASDH